MTPQNSSDLDLTMFGSERIKLHARQIEWQGRMRRYWVHCPDMVLADPPLVVVLHGSGADARSMISFTGMSDLAIEVGFMVVYPQGTGRIESACSWNSGGRGVYAARQGIDDVGFLGAVLDDLPRSHRFDAQRVYAVGFSNGAAMCYRWAAESPERLAGIAAVAGCMDIPPGARPYVMPVIHIHGTHDDFVPFEGGPGTRGFIPPAGYSVAETVRAWGQANQCRFPPEREELPLLVPDGTTVERENYLNDRDQTVVTLYKVQGAGHTWPGRPSPVEGLGRVSHNLNATKVIWEFLASWRNPDLRGPGHPESR